MGRRSVVLRASMNEKRQIASGDAHAKWPTSYPRRDDFLIVPSTALLAEPGDRMVVDRVSWEAVNGEVTR